MTYDEFYSLLIEHHSSDIGQEYYISRDRKNPLNQEDCLYNAIAAGGYSGGSCWDDAEATYHRNKVPEELFPQLLDVLKIHFNYINFSTYLNILTKVINYEYTIDEYYGNSTDYIINYIKLKDLYNELASDE